MEDLKPVRVFLEVAAWLSFAKAAHALKMTPATVTRVISRLESDLGQQLFVRTTRQVALTSAGTRAVARFSPIVAEFDRATQEIARARRADRGHLRINAPLSLGMRALPGLIDGFRLAYPRIALDVQLTDTLVDIMEADCDLAIRVSGPPKDKSTIWRKICEVPRVAVASPECLARLGPLETPDDLPEHAMLSYGSAGASETWSFRKSAQQRTRRAGTQVVSNNGDFLCNLALAGGGICVLPEFLVQNALTEGALRHVLPDWSLPSLWLTLYYPPYEQLPPLVATFSDYFEDYMRDLDGLAF